MPILTKSEFVAKLRLAKVRKEQIGIDHQLAEAGLRRDSKTGVGKVVKGNHYVHRSAEDVLPQELLERGKAAIKEFNYDIIKHDRSVNSLTFIQSPDWDSAPEPTVGDSRLVRANGTVLPRTASDRTQIYHHKWQFVRDGYKGFDVAASKRRSLQWCGLPNVDRTRIGYKDFWEKTVIPRLKGAP